MLAFMCHNYIWVRDQITKMGNKGSKGLYTFTKLKGTENYKKWSREIGFALQDTSLESYADDTSTKPKMYTES